MRSTYLTLLLALGARAYVDEENQAVVIEAAGSRTGRQFWGSVGTSFQPMNWMSRTPVYPASTQQIPMSPLANALCRTATGQLAWCNQYQFPGIMGWPAGGAGAWPGQGGLFPGGQPGIQYPGQPGGQYPGQPGGQYPGQPGGQYPGQPIGQYPGQPGGQYPGQPGGQYPGQPGGQYPGGFPGGQPGGFPGVQNPAPAPPTSPVVAEEEDEGGVVEGEGIITEVDTETESEPEASYAGCGRGKYFPIRYDANGTVAEESERVLYDRDGEHEKSNFRIVNGWPADEFEWPWIAALMNNGRQFCGGSLIDNKHILTAAHCVAHMSRYDVANLKVRLGDYKIKTSGESGEKIFESKAARVVRHKEFSQQTLHKDVAIITMEDPVPASYTKIRPVCLPSGHQKYAGQHGTVIGWGSLRENGPQPDNLMEMTVKIWDNKECKDTYGNAAPGGIMDHMLCAGKQGKDSCSGDSGGPMQIGTGNYWTQIGIVSWGIGCGKSHYPGVYTRVTEVKDWIDRILNQY